MPKPNKASLNAFAHDALQDTDAEPFNQVQRLAFVRVRCKDTFGSFPPPRCSSTFLIAIHGKDRLIAWPHKSLQKRRRETVQKPEQPDEPDTHFKPIT